MKQRIYKYDNVKALLIFLVVLGHMTSDYVSDSHLVRWVTLWIYTFHMPAFIFLSGLVHKRYITKEAAERGIKGETRLRLDKVLGFLMCGYALKAFLQFSRTLMDQHPVWSWFEEPGIPWYLIVMAEFELLFYLIHFIDSKVKPQIVISVMFVISAAVGYFPSVGDMLCLSRMINFMPIYALGYYMDMKKFLSFIEGKGYRDPSEALPAGSGRAGWIKAAGWAGIALSMAVCFFGNWGMYSWRKWFTGRRSYEYLQHFFSFALKDGWWVRPAVWAVAIAITLCVLAVVPDRDLRFVTTVGARTLNVYFWHRPLCYLFRNWMVLPRLCVLFGGSYYPKYAGMAKGLAFGGSTLSMTAAFIVYVLIAAAMTAVFSLKLFDHPCSDLMKLGAKVAIRDK